MITAIVDMRQSLFLFAQYNQKQIMTTGTAGGFILQS